MKADIGWFESDLKYAAYCTRVVLFSLYTILISVLSNVLLVNKLISNIKKCVNYEHEMRILVIIHAGTRHDIIVIE